MSAEDIEQGPRPETLAVRIRRGRMDAIDIVFGEADQRPVYIAAAVALIVWLAVLVWLSGFPSPWRGERGPISIPAGAERVSGQGAAATNSEFQWAAFLRGDGDAPEGLPPWPTSPGQERAWLDDTICGPFSPAQATAVSRAATAYRIAEFGGLCRGSNRILAQARLAPTLGAGTGAVLGGLILILLGAVLALGVYGFARVRDAYRRLYVSHHRPDPEGR
ncbi:hypothetical protein BH10PSE2_BH10PSE2_24510 [soil metagenome]